jgi:hypothetical protein
MQANVSRPSRRQLLKRVALALILILTIYTLCGYFLIPHLIRNQIVSQARTLLHREARMDEVRFNPFTLATNITGFVLSDRDGVDLLKVEHLLADVQISGLFRRAMRFKECRIDRPFLNARILQDGRPSIADLIETKSSDTGAKDSAESFQLPRLIIDRLILSGGGVGFADASRQPAYESRFEPLDLDIRNLVTLPDESGDHTITIGAEKSAVLRWTGHQTIEPLRFSGQLDITGFPISRLWDYFGRSQPLDIYSGSMDLSVPYEITRGTDKRMQANLKGVSATIRSLAARHRQENIDWVTVPELSVGGVNISWPAAKLDVEKVRLVGAHVLAKVADEGKLNWSSLLAERPRLVDTQSPWQLRISSADVENASVSFEDTRVEPDVKLEVAEVAIHAEGVSDKLEAPIPLTLKGRVQESGTIEASGTVAPSPLAADVKLDLRGLDLVSLRPYIQTTSAAKLASGQADLQGKVTVSGPNSKIALTAVAALHDIEFQDSDNARLAAWKRMQIDGITFDSEPGRARVKKITLDQPFANILIDKAGYLNLRKVTSGGGADTSANSKMPLSLEIGVVEFRDGTAEFEDQSLLLPFHAQIHSANGTLRDVSSFAAAPATLALEGRVDKTGFVKTGGTLRLSNPLAASEVNVQFRSIEMLTLTPYFAQFAGYEVKSGVLDLDVDYVIKDRRLVGDHTLVARDLVLGSKVKDSKAPGLAVRLAIALLKDREGRINLKVPVEGTVDSPEFNYNAVFWAAVRTILGNAAKAPFRAIGGLFGRDEDDLELVEFDLGRSDLLPAEQDKLSKVAEHLGPKKDLKLTIEGRFDPEADKTALKQQKLVRLIDSRRESAGATAAATGASTLETILEALFVEQFSAEALEMERQRATSATPTNATNATQAQNQPANPPSLDAAAFYERLRARLLEAQAVTDADLAGLASARTTAIVEALNKSGVIETTRVIAAPPAQAKRKKSGSTRVSSEIAMSADDDE